LIEADGAVQEAVVGVKMEVNKFGVFHGTHSRKRRFNKRMYSY
jgi:hypothetical protein